MVAGLTPKPAVSDQPVLTAKATRPRTFLLPTYIYMCVHVCCIWKQRRKKKTGKASTLRFFPPEKGMLKGGEKKQKGKKHVGGMFYLSEWAWALEDGLRSESCFSWGRIGTGSPGSVWAPSAGTLWSSHPTQKQAGRNILQQSTGRAVLTVHSTEHI